MIGRAGEGVEGEREGERQKVLRKRDKEIQG